MGLITTKLVRKGRLFFIDTQFDSLEFVNLKKKGHGYTCRKNGDHKNDH